MLKRSQVRQLQERAIEVLRQHGIVLTPQEQEHIAVVDFGLGEVERIGLEIVVYINNDRYCAKELVLFVGQTGAEHKHPPIRKRLGDQGAIVSEFSSTSRDEFDIFTDPRVNMSPSKVHEQGSEEKMS
jgi:D-lyxose ketol-isomerase